MAKMDPIETRQSIFELPSSGSNVTMYFPDCAVSICNMNVACDPQKVVISHRFYSPQWQFHFPQKLASNRYKMKSTCWWKAHLKVHLASSLVPLGHSHFQLLQTAGLFQLFLQQHLLPIIIKNFIKTSHCDLIILSTLIGQCLKIISLFKVKNIIRLGQKYLGQRHFGLLFTAAQKYARVGSGQGPWPCKT